MFNIKQLKGQVAIAIVVGLGVYSSGCSYLVGKDVQLDYTKAQDVSEINLPEELPASSPKALFPIPPTQPHLNEATVTANDRKKFVLPKPQSLTVQPTPTALPATAVTGANTSQATQQVGQTGAVATPLKATIGQPSKPTVFTDGTGSPALKIEGDAGLVQEKLLQTLYQAQLRPLNIDLKTGNMNILYQNKPMLLRLTRNPISTVVTVLENAHTLAPASTAQAIFQTISAKWSE